MQRVNLPTFYKFGAAMGELRVVDSRDPVANPVLRQIIFKSSIWLTFFLGATNEVALPNTRDAAQALRDLLGEYTAKETSALETGELLGDLFVRRLNEELDAFELIFERESRRVSIFAVKRKGIYDTEALIEKPEERFSEKVRAQLPAQTLYDFKEAGKCLAFDCPTAAGFHTLRGTEALIIRYYEVLAGHAWNLSQRDWGIYIRELKTLNAPDAITQRLDEIRRFERNPILHPENNVEPDKALPLFEMVGGVVVLMIEEIEKLNQPKTTCGVT